MHPVLTQKTIKLINSLEENGDLETKLKRLAYNELVRRLNSYELIDRHLTQKYKMNFNAFKIKKVVRKKHYSFEVEQDLWDWEMAQDGIESVSKRLKYLKDIK